MSDDLLLFLLHRDASAELSTGCHRKSFGDECCDPAAADLDRGIDVRMIRVAAGGAGEPRLGAALCVYRAAGSARAACVARLDFNEPLTRPIWPCR